MDSGRVPELSRPSSCDQIKISMLHKPVQHPSRVLWLWRESRGVLILLRCLGFVLPLKVSDRRAPFQDGSLLNCRELEGSES